MIKVGEHITLDFLGVKKDYSPEFNCDSTFPCLIGNLRIYDGVESHNGALPFQF